MKKWKNKRHDGRTIETGVGGARRVTGRRRDEDLAASLLNTGRLEKEKKQPFAGESNKESKEKETR